MVVACQIVLGVSRRGCAFLLSMVNYIIQLTILRLGPNLSQQDEKLLADMPADVRGVEARFNLKGAHTIFAVCPNTDCHAHYKPSFKNGSPIPIYPEICSHKEFKGGDSCGTKLLRPRNINGVTVKMPIKQFVGFSFKHWLAGLLSRPGFEKKMDSSWESCKTGFTPGEMHDAIDGEMLQNFNGPDGKHFSIGGEDGWYVFSLGLDFFNPGGNKQAGKKKSVGMVSLVCLNLPIDIQNQPENMFLYGVIPGPNEPPLACLNHYLTYLVDELNDFWSPGVRFSRTAEYFYGRLVLAAIVCVVCDLIAARKTAGFASIKHTQMCAMCHCTRKSHGLGNTDVHTWRRRTKQEFLDAANRHRAATDQKERKAIVDETGMRWSELLRLPYFDPSRFVVVDAMHNLFLGLIHEHFEILGIRLDNDDSLLVVVDIAESIPPDSYTHLAVHEQRSMKRLIHTLEAPMVADLKTPEGHSFYEKRFSRCHLKTLRLACELLNAPALPATHAKKTKTFKADYVKRLLAWVCVLISGYLHVLTTYNVPREPPRMRTGHLASNEGTF